MAEQLIQSDKLEQTIKTNMALDLSGLKKAIDALDYAVNAAHNDAKGTR